MPITTPIAMASRRSPMANDSAPADRSSSTTTAAELRGEDGQGGGGRGRRKLIRAQVTQAPVSLGGAQATRTGPEPGHCVRRRDRMPVRRRDRHRTRSRVDRRLERRAHRARRSAPVIAHS